MDGFLPFGFRLLVFELCLNQSISQKVTTLLIFMRSLKPRTWETTESWKTTENDIYARVSIGSFILNNQHSIEPLKSNDFSS